MQRLYFIASYPRSGNTWVRSFFYLLLRGRGMISPRDDTLRPMDELVMWDINPAAYRRVTGKHPRLLTVEQTAAARYRVHRLIAETASTPPILKTHAPFGLFAGAPTFNVGVTKGAVYLVRNPQDIAPSLGNFLGLDDSSTVKLMMDPTTHHDATSSGAWEPWSSWDMNVRSWLGARNFPVLVVRYEDLQADPKTWFARIASHAGLAASDDEVATIVDALTLEKMKRMVDSGEMPVPRKSGNGQFVGFQQRRSGEEPDPAIAQLTNSFAETMRHFGY